MGRLDVQLHRNAEDNRQFTKYLLKDLQALEHMLDHDLFEHDIRRIGAEQEFFIIDKYFRPSDKGPEILEKLDESHFTSELARFNLECNLDPLFLGENCFTRMEKQLDYFISSIRSIAKSYHNELICTGILPTIKRYDLKLKNITPSPRYYALNEALTKLRGDAYELRIKGIEELIYDHDSVLIEACNTSFQLHFQVAPHEFAELYNLAQFVSAPLLAVSTNSPILLGKRLWHETRIALFQQAVDTRNAKITKRDQEARVSFGNAWVNESVLELYKEDVARFRPLFRIDNPEDPFKLIEQGENPNLNALCLHNGTVYRWNRPCYGITDGKPHLRIENRVLPSGPTVKDSIANAAFYYGLMSGLSRTYQDIRKEIDFDDVRFNFFSAARASLDAQFKWLNGKVLPAVDLILKELLPVAKFGLKENNVDSKDIDKYLDIIQERAERKQNGSQWILYSYSNIKEHTSRELAFASITAAMLKNQNSGEVVHNWKVLERSDILDWSERYTKVEEIMTTDVFTVHEDDLIDLVTNLMDWKYIRHIPVEDVNGKLVGLVSYRRIIKEFGKQASTGHVELLPVNKIMTKELITINPDTSILEAINLMKEKRIACLPVVEDERLLGILTESDFVNMAEGLLIEKLKLNK